MDCSLRRFSLPLTDPLETAAGRIEEREGFLVRLSVGEEVGIGEATPLPGWTESLAACEQALMDAGEQLETDTASSALDGLSGAPAARHGIALACADLRARRADRPLYRDLGASDSVTSVPVNATIGDGPLEETVAAAETAVDDGYSCLKLKAGARSLAVDIERMTAVWEAVGPSVGLRVDANGAWSRNEATEVVEALAEMGVEYLEQPLSADDIEGLVALRDGPVDIAVDESLTHTPPEELLDIGAADRLILKPMVLGGPDRTMDVATLAAKHDIEVTVTTTVDAVVARLGAVHLAAAIDPGTHAGVATGDRLGSDLGPDPTRVLGGSITVPQTAGLGVHLSEGST